MSGYFVIAMVFLQKTLFNYLCFIFKDDFCP